MLLSRFGICCCIWISNWCKKDVQFFWSPGFLFTWVFDAVFQLARYPVGFYPIYLPHWIEQIQIFDIEKPTPLERYVEKFGLKRAGRMLWDGYSIIPAGRSGYRLGHLTQKRPALAFRGENCLMEILYAHHSHFDLYGNYISWFCGGMTVGDWHNLPRILDDFKAGCFPPLIDILVRTGPFGLFELGKEEYGYRELPEGYTGKCHLCVDVRKHLSEQGDLQELRPKEFYENI